jgi:4-aminobutyrate aminotransferase-like enzyme/Ser/Thr protein kinase RdoA (MazF antagonist)
MERTATRDVLEGQPPRLTPEEAERVSRERFGIDGTAEPLGSERDQNFRIAGPAGTFVLKISNADEDPAVLDMENAAMRHIARVDPGLPVPRLVPATTGEEIIRIGDDPQHLVRVITFLPGRRVRAEELSEEALRAFGRTLARLGRALRGFFHPAAGRVLLWDVRHALAMRERLACIADPDRRALAARAFDRFAERAAPVFDRLRAQPIHGDLTLDNSVFDDRGLVAGILDFGDMTHTALVADLVSGLEATMDRDDAVEAGAEVVAGYREITPLEDEELELLPVLLGARAAINVTMAAWRVERFPENADYIRAWEGAWPLVELVDRLGPDELGRALSGGGRRHRPTAELLERRDRVLGPGLLPLTYRRPLHLARGEGAWLIDVEGRRYLDCYNNVPVVGHGHPRVADAIARQVRRLNTNVRYLFDEVIELAERLVAMMPPGLDTVSFVNSGSEANDLAWRLMRAASGGQGAIITAFAYHGVTSAMADLSPEEWGEAGEPEHVARIPAPDGFRGRHRREEPGWAERYAEAVDEAVAQLAERGLRPAATYIDAGFTSDGILDPPPIYLQEVLRRTHEAGALYLADEVQAGYGRFGDVFWSFQASGIEPDVVTLGKPMGNGFPVAAVITRREIVERMADLGRYFSTFGGNPVACAASLAVLDVLEEEGLQERARTVGARMRAGLEELAGRHEAIGDVRGRGLMLGVELVRDRATRDPAPELADAVANGLRERGVLVGITGPAADTLKIRPPLVFDLEHAELFLAALDEALGALG